MMAHEEQSRAPTSDSPRTELMISTSDYDDAAMHQVVARSNVGTDFYLFNHQAGGHKPFLRSAFGEVCKPAIPLELKFYQSLETMHPQLKPFVPPFVGVISVDLNPHPHSSVSVAPASSSDNQAFASTCRVSEADASSPMDVGEKLAGIHLKSPTASATNSSPHSSHGKKRRLSKKELLSTPTSQSLSPPSSSYSAKLWKKERTRVSKKVDLARTSSFDSGPKDYLVLGDLTNQYSKPCVLDIKMGTRQHGEDAPAAKVKSHSAKCAATTSFTLGLRICGMQIYHVVEERYILWDKHWGRQLKEEDIEPALETYLSNGETLRWDVLDSLIEKLRQLRSTIESTRGLRFWGASLLVIFEGDLQSGEKREDVHLIDFAHCQMSPSLDTPDEGLLLGLTNMAKYFTSILSRRAQLSVSSSSEFVRDGKQP